MLRGEVLNTSWPLKEEGAALAEEHLKGRQIHDKIVLLDGPEIRIERTGELQIRARAPIDIRADLAFEIPSAASRLPQKKDRG